MQEHQQKEQQEQQQEQLDNQDLRELLIKGAEAYGLTLDSQHLSEFIKYKDILLEWNKVMNLTAIEDDREVILKHFVDSLSVFPEIERIARTGAVTHTDMKSSADSANGRTPVLPKQNVDTSPRPLSIIDVGTGAGFPGIPLKIVAGGLTVTLLDSLDKRVRFLKEVIASLNLKGIGALHGRAEDMGANPGHREKYDIAIARAVANLPVLLEYCMPLVKVGGYFIAMKGSSGEELQSAGKALEIFGGRLESVREFQLPFTDMHRSIILVKKTRQTPSKYPRKAGKPAKEPLL